MSIVMAAIHRTALIAVQPGPITTKRDRVRQRMRPVLKIDVIAFCIHRDWLTLPSLTVGLLTRLSPTNYFDGTNLKIRSSSAAGFPRPSRFEVEK